MRPAPASCLPCGAATRSDPRTACGARGDATRCDCGPAPGAAFGGPFCGGAADCAAAFAAPERGCSGVLMPPIPEGGRLTPVPRRWRPGSLATTFVKRRLLSPELGDWVGDCRPSTAGCRGRRPANCFPSGAVRGVECRGIEARGAELGRVSPPARGVEGYCPGRPTPSCWRAVGARTTPEKLAAAGAAAAPVVGVTAGPEKLAEGAVAAPAAGLTGEAVVNGVPLAGKDVLVNGGCGCAAFHSTV